MGRHSECRNSYLYANSRGLFERIIPPPPPTRNPFVHCVSDINCHQTNIKSILIYNLVFKYFIMTNYGALRN